MRTSRTRAAIVALAILYLSISLVKAQTLPGDKPGSYRAAYGYVVCDPGITVDVASTADVVTAVKKYLFEAARAGQALKIRASRHKFHTTTSMACPDQQYALNPNGSVPHGGVLAVALLHDKMDKVLEVDPAAHTMRIGAGMRLSQFLEAATAHKMSVMAGALPAYAGLTMAGILTSGAHGTGDMTISTIADMIKELTWVDGLGNIHTSKNASPEFNAISAGLGLTGIITEMTMQLTPPTNTKLITRYLANDTNLFEDIEKMLQHAPHMLVFWRPDFKMYSAYMMKPIDASVPATDDYMTLLPSFKGRGNMAKLYKGFQSDVYDANFPMVGSGEQFMCPTVAFHSVAKTWANKRDGTPVLYTIAPTNNMVASECDDNCAWSGPQYNGTAEDVHYAIEWDNFKDWIADIKSIYQKDLWEDAHLDKFRCMGPGYIWLRFGHPRGEYMHMAHGMKRPVYTQSTWLRSRGSTDAPMRYGWVTDLLEEVTLCKYGGRPHWGKNYARTFTHPKCPMKPLFPAWQAQLDMQNKYDPQKIYEPKIWSQVVNGEGYKYYPGCALNKDCFCTRDEHCSRGMACVPSNSFPEYNVCKPNWGAYASKVKDLKGWMGMWRRYKETGRVAGAFTSADQVAAHTLLGFSP